LAAPYTELFLSGLCRFIALKKMQPHAFRLLCRIIISVSLITFYYSGISSVLFHFIKKEKQDNELKSKKPYGKVVDHAVN
jgi:hypothetical protein